MENEVLALTYWVQENLYVTTESFSKRMALRWFRLFLSNREEFYRLALYGFVLRKQRDLGADLFPEDEFHDFCEDFLHKLSLAQRGLGELYPAPMFAKSEKTEQPRALRRRLQL
ncbi:hypothetical protein GEOBRER4_n2799 [Citrifermentans bremense]|uniref:Uncharacterized protein n=1 Tax=Citrifermentans bremense TaxID=60035 RepID=A0A6S6M913_9BACT|nr:hypothetical protein [Citrifermentans bremense]BCG47945.1 hypothetical protein GEOBRER4_n2799 [Citrifermentans bremense]